MGLSAYIYSSVFPLQLRGLGGLVSPQPYVFQVLR